MKASAGPPLDESEVEEGLHESCGGDGGGMTEEDCVLMTTARNYCGASTTRLCGSRDKSR